MASVCNEIYDMEFQDNERVIILGCFTKYRGVTVSRILRVTCSGDIDGTFLGGARFGSTPAFNGPNVIVIKKNTNPIGNNSRIICGGNFTTYNVQSRNGIVSLLPNGDLDTTFDIGTGFGGVPNPSVFALSLNSSDARIAVGGRFTSYNGTICNNICVLDLNIDNGNIDFAFVRGNNFGFGAEQTVQGLDYQTDNKLIVVGSNLTQYTCNNVTTSINNIVRLNTDGTVDATFLTNIGTGPIGGSTAIRKIKIQSDNKIIIAGSFTTFNGFPRNNIVRLNANGTVDTTFDIGTVAGTNLTSIEKILIQTDGKIILLGIINASYGSFPENSGNLRLNVDGTIDTTYNNTSKGFSIPSKITGAINQQNVIVAGQTDAAVYNNVNIVSLAKINPDGSIQCFNFPEKCCTNNGGVTASTYRVRNCSDLGVGWADATNPGACS